MEEVVEQIGIVALAEHLGSQEQHGGQGHRHEGTALEQAPDHLAGLSLGLGGGLGDHTLLGPGMAEQVEDHRQHRNHAHPDKDPAVAHLGDLFPVLTQHTGSHIADGSQHHGGQRAEGGADGAEDGQRGALLVVGGDDLGKRAVGDVDAGVDHAEEDVGHVDEGQPSRRHQAPDIQEHQHRGQRHRQREDPDPAAIAAVGLPGRPVDDSAPDGIVDRIPDPGDDGHDHHVEHGELQHIGVVLVQYALGQAEDQAGGQVAEGIAQLVLHADPAGGVQG